MTTSPLYEPFVPYEWSHITVRGPEAQVFLQGQLSQDVTSVGPEGVGSLLLSPTGVVLTSVWLLRDVDGFVLQVPRLVASSAFARLRRFLLRSDCVLELDEIGEGPFVTVGEQVEGAFPGPNEFAKELTPQCFGPSFVASTVSFSKGCFTGQELVGRLDARGSSVPWRLVRCSGSSVEAINVALASKGPEGPQGVTTAIAREHDVLALGFVHRSALLVDVLEGFDDVIVNAIT